MDRYHGSARPQSRPEDALLRETNRHRSQRIHSARAARKHHRDARRQWIIQAGATPATTPMWTSRDGWLTELRRWTESSAGNAELARRLLRPALLLRVAEILATHADHATGRHCAATNATIARTARCSPRTVTTVRATLREAGLAVEIRRGTGSAMTPHCRRRPSIWHLVSRNMPVDNARICHLPPSLCDRRLSHLGRTSPSGRTRPPTKNSSNRTKQRRHAPPPLAVQKLAAHIVAGSVGLNAVHPGHICAALTRSGLDLDTWTAPQILESLNADMRATGWFWPHHIERPGAFLASRLRRLPHTYVTPAVTKPIPDDYVSAPPPATPATRAAAIAYFRAHRADGRGARGIANGGDELTEVK